MKGIFEQLGDMFNPKKQLEELGGFVPKQPEQTAEQIIHTQNQKILQALLYGDKLTPISMLNRFGCLRASARIFNLRSKGWNIKTTRITTNSGKHVAEYSLDKHEE